MTKREFKKESNHRCDFLHHRFKKHNHFGPAYGFRCDGTDQCWMTESRQYGDKYLCIFHMPQIRIDDETRELQSLTLLGLISEWSDEDGEKAFVMPGIQCGTVSFSGKTFGSDISFNDGIFSGGVSFDNATFHGCAFFENTKFNHYADFSNASFEQWTDFTGALFSYEANFDKAAFGDITNFVNATFSSDATFKHARFYQGWFVNATFSLSWFTEATFDFVSFSGATFSKQTKFSNATFNEYADFSSTSFSKEAEFLKTTFNRNAEFYHAKFTIGPNMAWSVFEVAPNFHNATLAQGADFRLVDFKDRESRDAAPCYRTLKVAMNKVSNKRQEAIFYGLEQESLRNQKESRLLDNIFSHGYELFSDYGQSLKRPIVAFALVYISFFLIYSFIRYPMSKIYIYLKLGAPGFWEKLSGMIEFTTINITSPFRVWTENYVQKYFGVEGGELAEICGVAIRLVASVQTILSLSLITLFLLALRRTFKLN